MVECERAIVEIRWDPDTVRLSQIAATSIRWATRRIRPRTSSAGTPRCDEDRRLLIRIGAAAACVGT